MFNIKIYKFIIPLKVTYYDFINLETAVKFKYINDLCQYWMQEYDVYGSYSM